MANLRALRTIAILLLLMMVCTTTISSKIFGASPAIPQKSPPSDDQEAPWTASETVAAASLAKTLSDSKSARSPESPKPADQPIIVCVGFHTLFEGAHIRGASFHGPASTAQGLTDLKAWAKSLPRSANLILYCGCCPLAHCPNVRPAFTALHEMGFTRLRMLILPHDFATDWVQPGYPIEKGK
jgi:hypothetical protein